MKSFRDLAFAMLIAVLLVLPLLVAVGPTVATDNATTQSPASPRYSPEKLARIRQALVAQMVCHAAMAQLPRSSSDHSGLFWRLSAMTRSCSAA